MSEENNLNKYIVDPTGRKKVILSIDGGGMRGAITVAMLAELEKQSGKSCHEIFDMFVGTSTGAIIGAGLAMGYSAEFILEEVYKKRLPEAFDQKQGPWLRILTISFAVIVILAALLTYLVNNITVQIAAWIVLTISLIFLAFGLYLMFFAKTGKLAFAARLISHGLKYAYQVEPIKDSLIELVSKKNVEKISDVSEKILLTTTKNLETRETAFVVNKGDGAMKFQHWSIVDAVASSASAPVFFEPYRNRFIDGGVSPFGNPCFCAAVEAMEYIRGEYRDNEVILVSIGTGYPPENIDSASKVAGKIVFDWIQYVALEGIEDSANQQVYITRRLYGARHPDQDGRIDFRRYNPSLKQSIVEDLLGRKVDIDTEQLGLDSFGKKEVETMIEIGRAYANEVDWSLKNAITWEAKFKGGQPNPANARTNNIDW